MLNSEKDFQEVLHEVLATKLYAKTKQEKLLQEILDKKDKIASNDFQEMLKKSVKAFSDDRVKKELKPKIAKKETYAKDINVAKQVKAGVDVDKIVNDLDKNKDKESENQNKENEERNEQDETLSSREIALKYMYSSALEEYYTLKEKLNKHQIRDNDIALDDRNYEKLLKYENYLRKCDTLFKSINGKYISNQDENISKKENKYAYDDAKSERKILSQHEDSINEIDELNDQIKKIAEDIIKLNESIKYKDVPDYDKSLEILERDYLELNAKMHALTPNMIELYRQEEQKEEQDKITTRIVGTLYQQKKDKRVLDQDVVRLDRRSEKKEDLLEDAAEREKIELQNTNIKLANSYIDAAEVALDKQDIVGATQLVGKAKKVVGDKKIEDLASDKKTDFQKSLKKIADSDEDSKEKQEEKNETDLIDGYLYASLLSSDDGLDLSPLQQECAKAVYSPEERDENVLAREAKEELDKVKNENIKEKDISRTR